MSEEHNHKHCCCVCGCEGTEGDCGWNCKECECCEQDKENFECYKQMHCMTDARLYVRTITWHNREDGVTETYAVDAHDPNLYQCGVFSNNDIPEFDTKKEAFKWMKEWETKYPRKYIQDYRVSYTEKLPSRYNQDH
jgi:hypothetical protein